MAQNITLQGASYTDVPAVILPKTGGGSVQFVDVTDTTATASDVLSGKYFYTAAGVKTVGTGNGGGATPSSVKILLEQDEDGYLLLTDTALIPTAVGVYF